MGTLSGVMSHRRSMGVCSRVDGASQTAGSRGFSIPQQAGVLCMPTGPGFAPSHLGGDCDPIAILALSC
jgi:hypothetical protein